MSDTKHILIIEDEPDIARMYAALIHLKGMRATVAVDGLEAMACYWQALASEARFDGILLDLALPRMDGLSVAERVRGIESEGYAARTQIFGMTAYGNHIVSQESLNRAQLDVLKPKPVDNEIISQWLDQLPTTRHPPSKSNPAQP